MRSASREVDQIISERRGDGPARPESPVLLVLDHYDHVGPVVRGHLHDAAARAVPAREEPRDVTLRHVPPVAGGAAREVRRVREEPLASVPVLRAPCLLRPQQRPSAEAANVEQDHFLEREQQLHFSASSASHPTPRICCRPNRRAQQEDQIGRRHCECRQWQSERERTLRSLSGSSRDSISSDLVSCSCATGHSQRIHVSRRKGSARHAEEDRSVPERVAEARARARVPVRVALHMDSTERHARSRARSRQLPSGAIIFIFASCYL